MPHKSLFPPVDIPNVDLWTLLFEREHLPFPEDKEIFTDGQTGRTLTFAALRSTAVSFGKGLKALWRWRRGDVLALYTPNHIDVPVVISGALWAGAVVTPANPLYTPSELAFQLKDSGAKALVTQLPFLPQALEAAAKAGIPRERVILLGDKRDPEGRTRHFVSVRATAYTKRYIRTLWGGEKRGRGVRGNIDPRDELAVLVYSSGTTGLPKGVCLSHGNVVANIVQSAAMDGLHFLPHGGLDGKGDKHLGITPFFHIYGLTCCMFMSMFLGWELVVMERFDIEHACRLIERHRLTFAYVPPPVILAFGKHPVVSKYDLTSLRLLHSGGAPLTRELAEGLWDRLKLPVKQGYGLSETSPVTHIQSPDEWAKFMGSVGKLVPNLEAKIVDLDGKEVGDGEEGELWVKGPNIFLGYWNQPDKTKDTMSDDGFFKTGDVFKKDKHGNYYCVDRLKELIKYNAFQVAPAELEGLLLGHEHVQDAAVIGVWDNNAATELPRAYVVLHSDQIRDEAKSKEIAEWAAQQTAPHKKLRGGVIFVDQIPKSPSGKILRRVLREQVKKETRKEGAKL